MQQTRESNEARTILRQQDDPELGRQRAIIGLSLVGMASMAATSLFQAGILRRLPSPPLPGSNSERVGLADFAYPLGVPDGAIALAGFRLNIPLAALSAGRGRDLPWLPLLTAAKATIDLAISGWYAYQAPARLNAWCIYNLAATAANVGILACSLPSAATALGRLARRRSLDEAARRGG